AALAEAARAAGEQLVDDVVGLAPASGEELASSLRVAVSRLAAARTRAPEESAPIAPRPVRSRKRSRRDAPTCGFELHDAEGLLGSYRGPGADLGSLLAPGRVFAKTGRGEEIFSLACAPFLALRDLAAFAARIAAGGGGADPVLVQDLAVPGRGRSLSLALDTTRAVLTVGERPAIAVSPLLLARAFLEAAVDFCGVAAARNPWQAENPWVAELRASAAERLELVKELAAGDQPSTEPLAARARPRVTLPRAPLGAGRTRRVVFRRAWRVDVGIPAAAGLFARAEAIVAAGSAAVVALDLASGAERWRAPGAAWATVAAGRVFAISGTSLHCRDVATGAPRWTRPLESQDGLPRAAFALRGGPLVLAYARALEALDVGSGRTLWTFVAPGASALHAAGSGALAIVASEAGLAYGIDETGRTAWRVRLPGPAAAPARHVSEGALLASATALGGALLLVDPATGTRGWEAPLDFVPSTAPAAFAGLLATTGTIGGDPVVTALDPASGRALWTESAPVPGGPLALASLPSTVIVKTASGTCAAISREGSVLWTQRRAAPHPPSANLAPVPARGLVLVPSEQVQVLDPATGAVLGSARCGAPAHLHVGADLSLVAMDAEGLVTALRVATHLGVV
ncbi:MAG TPA: PQQ-binding-like beta-propeller repeat protein, partial [Anaeromyxobacteraceae bacterium]|nr:PQQ-binding-like beta-propeller repeat protein [Anaeromyxobacteraceae bacterium]